MKQKKIILGVLLIAAIAIVVLIVKKDSLFSGVEMMSGQEVSTNAPIDVVFDFYEPWLAALQSTSTDPYQEGLAEAPILSESLRADLAGKKEGQPVDPVLCQDPLPTELSGRPLLVNDEKAEILIFSRENEMAGQAIVTLLPLNGGWYIDKITCSRGEFGEEREFSFEQEGYLLKSDIAPLDPEYWHIVFEQDGTSGHTAKLFFDAESKCTDLSGNEAVCTPDSFVQASKVMLQGQMTEYGVEVKNVNFMEE